tara:strand:- start:1025 stop:1465 length:441 start_codon:yes stop_codon:yes gene_type:complete
MDRMDNERKTPYTNKEVRERLESELARNNVDFSNKAALAKKLGCSPTTIFRWMSGSLPKDPALMYEFAKMFNIDMIYWISGDRSHAVPESVLDEEILRESLATVEAFQSTTGEVLTDEQKAKLVNMTYSDEVAGSVLRKTVAVITK